MNPVTRCGGFVCPSTGEEWRGRPALSATVRVLSMDFFRKIVTRHDVGLGEAYMDGAATIERDSNRIPSVLACDSFRIFLECCSGEAKQHNQLSNPCC